MFRLMPFLSGTLRFMTQVTGKVCWKHIMIRSVLTFLSTKFNTTFEWRWVPNSLIFMFFFLNKINGPFHIKKWIPVDWIQVFELPTSLPLQRTLSRTYLVFSAGQLIVKPNIYLFTSKTHKACLRATFAGETASPREARRLSGTSAPEGELTTVL